MKRDRDRGERKGKRERERERENEIEGTAPILWEGVGGERDDQRLLICRHILADTLRGLTPAHFRHLRKMMIHSRNLCVCVKLCGNTCGGCICACASVWVCAP